MLDAVKKRVQSPRRRDFKDFSAPRDFRSPNRFNGNHDSGFLLPGYALSPDEDEDSGADSLNEQISKFYGRQACSCSHFGWVGGQKFGKTVNVYTGAYIGPKY